MIIQTDDRKKRRKLLISVAFSLSIAMILQTSEIYETCFDIFQSGNAKLALLATTEPLGSQRSAVCCFQYIFEVYIKDTTNERNI